MIYDLVIVQFNSKKHLYRAPVASGCIEGDEVTVEFGDDVQVGVVDGKIRINEMYDERYLNLIGELTGETAPFPKIKDRIVYIPMRYEEEDDDGKISATEV